LILSVAKYYTPKGKIIQDTGVTPNVVIAASDDAAAAIVDDEDGGTPDEPQQQKPQQKEDDQLRKALDVLKAKANQKS